MEWDKNMDMEEPRVEMLLRQIGHGYMYGFKKRMTGDAGALHGGQAGILFCLKCNPNLSQKEIAKHLGLTASTITTAIQKLEGMGYLERHADKVDKRVLKLKLTEKGCGYIDMICKAGQEMNEIAMRGINKEEELLLHRLLKQMRDNLDKDKEMTK